MYDNDRGAVLISTLHSRQENREGKGITAEGSTGCLTGGCLVRQRTSAGLPLDQWSAIMVNGEPSPASVCHESSLGFVALLFWVNPNKTLMKRGNQP